MQTTTPATVHAAETPYILDVREPDERAQAHIDGSTHIPMGSVIERIDELPNDRTLYVLCHAGGRSAQVATYLEGHGYDAVNIDGGIVAWHHAQLPLVMGDER